MANCPVCLKEVEWERVFREKTGKVRGKSVRYTGIEARCLECGEVLVLEDLDAEDQKVLFAAYREQEKLISIPEILQVMDKYKIGKRPLSLMLGWGEGTVTRYLNGDLPTRQYSTILKKILADEGYYAEILEANKEAITRQAYRRSRKALAQIMPAEEQLTMEAVSSEALEQVTLYMIRHDPGVPEAALHHLLYYAQGFALAFGKNPLFPETCKAHDHGLDYTPVSQIVSRHANRPGTSREPMAEPTQLLLDQVMRYFGCYSPDILSAMVRGENPWRTAMTSDSGVMDLEGMGAFFNEVREKHLMLHVSDIRDYSLGLFEKLV